ncbi:MAG: preprotein translocase subunit SecE [Lachnospiraceae bacterium]|nr:preprotein translocase subunit SecE [Lachnospiraceae bacterium]
MGDSAKTNAPKTSFWKSVKTEFGKIIWPDKNDLLKQSAAVLCISIVMGLIITFLDTLIQYGINFLTAL